MEIAKVGIAGFGTMGSEIALVAAAADCEVNVYEIVPEVIEHNLRRLPKVLRMMKRESSEEERTKVMARIEASSDPSSLADCDLVIEAVLEKLELKKDLLSQLGKEVKEDAILATNTSSFGVTQLASASGRPDRFLGLHFFNPPSQMQLVEVVPGLLTSEATRDTAIAFVEKLGKKPVVVKETPGFVVNRVLVAMAVEAMSLVEHGIATVKEVDDALRLGAGWPLGPFKLVDLVGLDVFLHACESIYSETGDSKFHPPLMLKRYVSAGLLGRKTRRGFYQY